MFGYNNVCINWDYTPSRELTAMIYPFVEYPLIAYAVLDYIQIYRDYLDKELPSWFFKLATGALPIKILLLSWFRMIFVFDSFQNTAFHTLPFQGLQVSLVLVAVQNSLYWTTHKSPLYVKQLGQAWTHRLIWAYVACLLAVTAFKITVVTSIFANKPIAQARRSNGATGGPTGPSRATTTLALFFSGEASPKTVINCGKVSVGIYKTHTPTQQGLLVIAPPVPPTALSARA
jgi:hypothetical protein